MTTVDFNIWEFNIYDTKRFMVQSHKLLKNIPPRLYSIFKQCEVVIAGGAITSVFSGNPINDYDLYCSTEQQYQTLLSSMRALVDNPVEGIKIKESFQTENAVTFKCNYKLYQVIHTHLRDQVTHRSLLGDSLKPEERSSSITDILSCFDFTVCMGGFLTSTEEYVLYKKFFEHIASRTLCFNTNSRYPICALARVQKYLKKGYHISGSEIIKMGLCVANLEIQTYEDLKYQLLGIDTFLFKDLTENLIEQHGKDTPIDYGIVMDSIDRALNELLDTQEYLSGLASIEPTSPSDSNDLPFI